MVNGGCCLPAVLSSAPLSFPPPPFLPAAAVPVVVVVPPPPGALAARAELRLPLEVPRRKYLQNNI